MSNFKTGERVRVVFDKNTENENMYDGTIDSIADFPGMKGTRYHVKYDDEDWVQTGEVLGQIGYYYTLERLTILVEECKQKVKGSSLSSGTSLRLNPDCRTEVCERLENNVECKSEKSKMPAFLKPKTFNSCPFCNIAYDSNFSQEGWAEIEKKEFKISGLCAKCQQGFFK
jgi:hypothetical protein